MNSVPSALTRRERVRRALTHQPVDRIPTQINYTGDMGAMLAAHFGAPIDRVPAALDNHLLRVDIDFAKPLSEDGKVVSDWWGVGFSVESEGYLDVVNPLAGVQDLDSYAWPDPEDAGLLDSARAAIAGNDDACFVVPNLGFALFERAWTMRGMEQFLMDLSLDTGYAAELLDRITEIQLRLIERYIELGVDGAYFGDDYGAQKNLIFSPRMWRAQFKPRLARCSRRSASGGCRSSCTRTVRSSRFCPTWWRSG